MDYVRYHLDHISTTYILINGESKAGDSIYINFGLKCLQNYLTKVKTHTLLGYNSYE